MTDFEACLVVAPGDAVGPAVLLTVGGGRGAQVLLCRTGCALSSWLANSLPFCTQQE